MSPRAWTALSGLPLLTFHTGDTIVEEGAIMIRGGGINVASGHAKTNLAVDILGYFIENPDGKGRRATPVRWANKKFRYIIVE